MKRLAASLAVMLSLSAFAQDPPAINPKLLTGHWPASWITCPDVPQRDYGVYHFRKTFSLAELPASFVVHASADNRYRLWVNGQPVCSGPARGDLYQWYFETVDIAPYLRKGDNTLAALVWNMGVHAPVAQISNQTAFVLQGNGENEQVVNTGKGWKVWRDAAYAPCSLDNGARLHSYMVVGPGDSLDAARFPWGWEKPGFNDAAWKTPVAITQPVVTGFGTDNLWTLAPRNIPLMFERAQRIPMVRRAEGISPRDGFLQGKSDLVIPAGSQVRLLLDQTHNTVAYPELRVSGGKGGKVKLTYAEALFDKKGAKGNRDEIEGKEIRGNYDVFMPDGGAQRHFRPLWFRTWRYMEVEVTTAGEALVIHDLYGTATGYPFEVKAAFQSNDSSLRQIWDIGWRTAQLCAGETYFDCPYYEQLQYEGDTRIQALISLYVTGDDRLMRKAILDFYQSRVPEGLTQGRYPSNRLQVIPPFSLFWVSMIYDYWMHRRDETFVSAMLVPVMGVLDWYARHIDARQSMLGPMRWWNFVDWNHAFPGGVPDGAEKGNSAVITLQYVYTLRQAAELFTGFGRHAEAARYRQQADSLAAGTYRQCFNTARALMANTPEQISFSQHASIMAVLSGAVSPAQAPQVLQRVLTDSTLSQATFYYRFYLNQALKQAGMSEMYYGQLGPWRDMIAIGLTTFAENPDPARSDCHAWSSSPNYDFLATICGIVPAAPGFSKVTIAPALGALQEVRGTMPHPDGPISVHIRRSGPQALEANITLPPGLTGELRWQGKTWPLKSGQQQLKAGSL